MASHSFPKIDQKEYLKKYLSGDKVKKKKKDKKHKKSGGSSVKVKIIDDDINHLDSGLQIDEELLLTGDDAPQIVGEYIEENPSNSKVPRWKSFGIKEEPQNEGAAKLQKEEELWGQKVGDFKIKQELSKDKKRSDKSPDNSPPRRKYRKHRSASRSPTRKSIKSPSPTRKSKKDYSPKRNRRNNSSDNSPDRDKRKHHSKQSPIRKPKTKRSPDQTPPPRGRIRSRDRSNSLDQRDLVRNKDKKRSPHQSQQNKRSPDQSPRRIRKNSDQSPPRKGKSSTIIERKRSPDQSPPRRRRNSDQSPPRRSRNSPSRERKRSLDQSPPRRKRDFDQSPSRNEKQLSNKEKRRSPDQSPPRRNRKDDQSPPRKRNKSPKRERKRSADQSPTRKVRNSPSKNKKRSPIRQRRNSDQSPPRKGKNSPPRCSRNSPPPRIKLEKNSTDLSPPRQRNQKLESPSPPFSPPPPQRRSRWERLSNEKSISPPPTHKPKVTKTLEGKKAGLQDAQSLQKETMERRHQENILFDKMSSDISGRNAEVQVRTTGRQGRRAREAREEDPEERRRKEAHEEKKKQLYDRWGKGLKQIEDYKNRVAEQQHESNKPLARYSNDEDLERHLREQERVDDPMLQYMREKRKEKEKLLGKPEVPIYQGSFPENRFGIRPGYRWDGVDRSNGYEKKYFDVQNEKRARQDEAYKYSVEDM